MLHLMFSGRAELEAALREQANRAKKQLWIREILGTLKKDKSIHNGKIGIGESGSPSFELPVEEGLGGGHLLEELSGNPVNRARVFEVDSHPLGGICDVQPARTDFLSHRIILRGPRKHVIILSVAKVEKAAHGRKKPQRRVERALNRGRKNRVRRGPAMLLLHGGHEREPAGEGVVTVTARSILHIRFEMKNSVPEFAVAGPRNLRQVSREDLRLPGHHLRKQPIAQVRKKLRGTTKKTAIEQGENRFRIIRVELRVFGEALCRYVQLQRKI